jgi:hypothetical protein
LKRLIAAVSFAVLACSTSIAFAQHSGPIPQTPLDRPLRGMRDPLDIRDPLMRPPVSAAPLPPQQPSGADASQMFRDLQPRPLPGQQQPLMRP